MNSVKKTPVLRRLAWTALAVQFTTFMLALNVAIPYYPLEYLPAHTEATDWLLTLWWPQILLVLAVWNPWAGRLRFRFVVVLTGLCFYFISALLLSIATAPLLSCQYIETVPTGRRYECMYNGSDVAIFEKRDGTIEMFLIERLY